MAQKTVTVTDFRETGMNQNIRGSSGGSLISHFDTEIDGKLKQRLALEEDTVSTNYGVYDIEDISLKAYAMIREDFDISGVTEGFFALGIAVGDDDQGIIFKYTQAGREWDVHSSHNFDSEIFPVLFNYKEYFYGYTASGVWRGLQAAASTNANWQAITVANWAHPIWHPADDMAYFFIENIVYRNDDGVWDGAVLTLPTNQVIRTACAYQDYLIIIAYDANANRSTAYLWDRDSGLSTVTAKYDLGKGEVRHVATIDGIPMAVSMFIDSEEGLPNPIYRFYVKSILAAKKTVKQFSWAFSKIGDGIYVTDEKMYFGLQVTRETGGDSEFVVASIDSLGRLDFSVSVEDAVVDSTRALPQGVFNDGDGWWVAQDSDQKAFSSTVLYGDLATYETLKYRATKPTSNLDFVGLTISGEPHKGTTTVYFRQDNATAWTTLTAFASSDNVMKHSITKQGATNKPSKAEEIQFKITKGGTSKSAITGLYMVFDEIDDEAYG